MRRRSEIFDLGIIFGLTLAGFNRLPMILIVVGAARLRLDLLHGAMPRPARALT